RRGDGECGSAGQVHRGPHDRAGPFNAKRSAVANPAFPLDDPLPVPRCQTEIDGRAIMPEAPHAPTQNFTVSHLNEDDFNTGGLRSYSAYRDLGLAPATGGLVQAHVIRMTTPFSPELSERHHHDVQFQMAYVLKGWFSTEFEGHGVQVFRE